MDVCRVCLVEEADVFLSLFSKLEQVSIAEMMSYFTGLEIAKGDGLPRFICKECSEDVVKSYKIRRKCLDSDRTLRSILEKSRENIKVVELYLKKEVLKGNSDVESTEINKLSYISADVIKNVAENNKLMSLFDPQDHTADNQEYNETVTEEIETLSEENLQEEGSESVKKELITPAPLDADCSDSAAEDETQYTADNFSDADPSQGDKKENEEYETLEHPTEEEYEYAEYLEVGQETVEEVQYTVETDIGEEQIVLVQRLDEPLHEGKIICCGCEMHFAESGDLQQHSIDQHKKMRIKNNAKPFECQVCFKRFVSEKRLHFHQTYVYREKNHVCEQCTARFTCRGSLLNHMKTHADRTYTCETCNKSFYTSSTLQSHRLLHSDLKRFLCTEPDCSKSFLRKSDLHIHLVSHSDERPFVCEICSSRFKSKAHLVHHGKVHTREKPYKCNKCEKSFGTYSARNVHQLAHEGIHPYKCNFCDKIYQRNTKLQVHIRRIHTGERPFACDICKDTRFYQNWELTAHKKKVHQAENITVCSIKEELVDEESSLANKAKRMKP
ncbi:zinc finger protein 436-like [Topomyia yanbarensis]|uniref:zinc finger protein 436-like n=1 Tax=Topomyia yanbarensis TaxID=2498891 RepID=UPI00273CF3BF|nr:zinc finger protein 436-like [Topomyia yanbarensis]